MHVLLTATSLSRVKVIESDGELCFFAGCYLNAGTARAADTWHAKCVNIALFSKH